MMTTVLAASGVWKSYDGRSVVLRDVNLEARAGEAVLIWGANGSGKTTLLSILGGLDIPTKGSVVLGGREIARLKESALAKVRLHDVGFVFQTHNLIDDLTRRRSPRDVRTRSTRGPPTERNFRRGGPAGRRRPGSRERSQGDLGGRTDRGPGRERNRGGPRGVRTRAHLLPRGADRREP